jgi:hypothetical protein
MSKTLLKTTNVSILSILIYRSLKYAWIDLIGVYDPDQGETLLDLPGDLHSVSQSDLKYLICLTCPVRMKESFIGLLREIRDRTRQSRRGAARSTGEIEAK